MMNVKMSVPTSVLYNRSACKIVADGEHGNFCVLPRHIDFTVPLVPGLLILTDDAGHEFFFANDHGLLVKQGEQVSISVRRAVQSEDLETLQDTVRDRFVRVEESDLACQTAVASLEANFLRRFLEMQTEALL